MVDVITLDQEKIAQTLSKAGVHPKVAEIFIELHETQRALQQLVNELMNHNAGLMQAVQILGHGFKTHGEHLRKIEAKFSDPHKDLVKNENYDG